MKLTTRCMMNKFLSTLSMKRSFSKFKTWPHRRGGNFEFSSWPMWGNLEFGISDVVKMFFTKLWPILLVSSVLHKKLVVFVFKKVFLCQKCKICRYICQNLAGIVSSIRLFFWKPLGHSKSPKIVWDLRHDFSDAVIKKHQQYCIFAVEPVKVISGRFQTCKVISLKVWVISKPPVSMYYKRDSHKYKLYGADLRTHACTCAQVCLQRSVSASIPARMGALERAHTRTPAHTCAQGCICPQTLNYKKSRSFPNFVCRYSGGGYYKKQHTTGVDYCSREMVQVQLVVKLFQKNFFELCDLWPPTNMLLKAEH